MSLINIDNDLETGISHLKETTRRGSLIAA